MRSSWILLAATAILLGLSFIRPNYLKEQSLQHVPTLLAWCALAWLVYRRSIAVDSLWCICIFLWLHLLGARYIYSYVPYDRWCEWLLGISPADAFSWQRNHYDRFVHLAFGILLMIPCARLAMIHGGMRRGWCIVFALTAVATMSAVYEVFEWSLTLMLAPDQADAYNGQQGDMFDAQKDMALAMAGSLLGIPLWWWRMAGTRST